MKSSSIILVSGALAALLVQTVEVHGQPPSRVRAARPLQNVQSSYSYEATPYYYYVPWPRYYWGGGGTAAGGYARGLAALTHAQGQYNLLTAEARVVHAEAQRREIENHELAAETYFAMRQANREARAAERGPRPTAEDLARWAEMALPDRLGVSELSGATGEVSWPVLLQAKEFAAFRAYLEKAFAQRATDGVLAASESVKARSTAKAMLEELKKYVRDVRPQDYTAARRFLESLAMEAQLPVM